MSTKEEVLKRAEQIKVFVSYAWDTEAKNQWVIDLASELRNDGINVVLDRFELEPGSDVYKFMESSISDESITHIMLICDRKYAEKSNSRKGGTGVESSVISPALHQELKNKKFIPIVREVDATGLAYLPTYLNSRIFLDFSDVGKSAENYLDLKREILGLPEFKKPPIGKLNLQGLLEEDNIHFSTRKYAIQIEKFSKDSPHLVNGTYKELLNHAREDLDKIKKFTELETLVDAGKIVHQQILDSTQIRDDIIDSLKYAFRNASNINFEETQDFLSDIRNKRFDNNGIFYDWWGEYNSFFVMEIFIYMTALSLKYKNYEFLANLVNSSYFLTILRAEGEPYPFTALSTREFKSLNAHFDTPSPNIAFSKMLYSRINESFSNVDLFEANTALSVISSLTRTDWPNSLTTPQGYRVKCPLATQLVSIKHFNRVKEIFQVTEPFTLRNKAKQEGLNTYGYQRAVIKLNHFIDLEKIATQP